MVGYATLIALQDSVRLCPCAANPPILKKVVSSHKTFRRSIRYQLTDRGDYRFDAGPDWQ